MSTFSEKTLPSADDVARAILGSALHETHAAERAVELLKPDDFLSAANNGDSLAAVFQAIASLMNKGRKPTHITVDAELKRLGIAPKNSRKEVINSSQYLLEMSKAYSAGASMDEYCHLLKTYGYRRRLFLLGTKLRDLSTVEGMDLEQYMTQAEAEYAEASAVVDVGDEPVTMGEILRQQLEEHRNRKQGEFIGLRTGFKALDLMLCGMRGGDYIVVAARPAVGKTTLVQDILDYNATDCDHATKEKRVAVLYPLEMMKKQLGDRTLAAMGGLNGRELRSGLIDKRRLDDAERELEKKGMFSAKYLLDWSARSVPEIRRSAMRIKRKHGRLDIIAIDYLQLMKGHGVYGRSGNRAQEVGEISRAIKEMALELQVPVIVVSQLNRAIENRKGDDARPQLSDLRETGDIEQDADVVMMLYREGAGDPASTNTTTEVYIRKNRNGPVGMAELEFVGERTTFLNKG